MKKLITLSLVVLAMVAAGLWFFVEPPLSSPTGENTLSRFLPFFPHLKTQKIVYGFLPYWNLDKVVLQPELTNLAYFSLTIDEDGNTVTQAEGGGQEPGYRQLQSDTLLTLNQTAKNFGSRTDIVFTQFDNDAIESFLNSPAAQANFLSSLDSLLLAYPFNGVNLDIEYQGEASDQLRTNYTQFVKLVRQHLTDNYEDIQLSIDVYAAAASKQMLWEVNKLAEDVDYLIVMAYDFHRSSSPRAGPVAPLLQEETGWKESINAYLKDLASQAPTEKLLLGIPFYGYEWQTTSTEPNSFTLPQSGATASYQRVTELLANRDELQLTEYWDDQALAPYLSYVKNGQNYLVYYENAKSIGYKLEYVNQLDLGGIAIWSLGYEGESRDLWESVDQGLKIK